MYSQKIAMSEVMRGEARGRKPASAVSASEDSEGDKRRTVHHVIGSAHALGAELSHRTLAGLSLPWKALPSILH